MAILDNLLVRVQPVTGDTVPKNIVDSANFTGTGTPTLGDASGTKFWQVATGTLLKTAASFTMANADSGVTIALRFRRTANGTDSFMPMVGWLPSGGAVTNCPLIGFNGADSYRGRLNNSAVGNTATSGKASNVIHTLVWRFETSSVSAQDFGKLWFNQVGRVGDAPDVTSSGSNAAANTYIEAFINCQTSAGFDLFDFMVWSGTKTDAECAAIADDIRAQIPAPGGGSDVDPPTFTVAPAASAIGQTSATVTATINETGSIFWVAVPQGEATPSVAQVIAGQNAAGAAPIDAGSAVGTTSLSEVASGFTADTDYKFCVVAQDDEPTPNVQTSVTVVNFTTASAGDTTPPVFTVAPAVTSVSQTTATVSATIDETGSIFWVVVPSAESTPSVAQVIAGQNAAGGTPTDAGSAVGTTTLSEGVAGMAASTAYKACFVAQDDEGAPNVQVTVTTVGFTTAAVPVGTITLTGLADNTATLWSDLSGISCTVMNEAATSVVVAKTGLTANAGGTVTFNDAAITAGTWYTVVIVNGTNRGVIRIQAT